jgi:lipopolysaccharide export system protein LptA
LKKTHVFFILFLLFSTVSVVAQDRIELVSANELEGSIINGKNVRILTGNVALKQGGAIIYCQKAFHYYEQNEMEAFDRVRITQGDSFSVTGDKLFYDGNTKLAQIRGNEVILKDNKATLYTQFADYDMSKKTLLFFNGGRVVDNENTLTSERGNYVMSEKLFTFIQNVVLKNTQYTMTCDTLLYNSGVKIAYFRGKTKIVSKDGVLFADKGQYNTVTKLIDFQGRSRMDYKDYTVSADVLNYNQFTGKGIARRGVEIKSFKDSTIVLGELAYFDRLKGYSKVYANALMKNKFGDDTLYLKADTLISINDTLTGNRKVLAYHNVRVFHKQMQAKCDSLVYNLADSVLNFYQDPVLWSSGSQVIADTIFIRMKQQKIHKMFLRKNAFLISSDSLKNYNQVKGRNMVAYFNDSTRIEKIDVKGNGESIYFALEGDTSLVGMNKVQCSDMTVRFRGKKVKTITFLKKPDALFVPPQEIQEPEKRLKGFRWRITEQPSLETVLSKNDYSGIEIPLILPKTLQIEAPKKEEKPLTRKEKIQQKKLQKQK